MVAGGLTSTPAARAPWLAFAAALALAGWLGWQAYGPEDLGDPLATSLVALEKQNRLTVFSAQLSPVVASDDERLLGMLKSRQIAVIPARVDYAVDFSKLGRERLAWAAYSAPRICGLEASAMSNAWSTSAGSRAAMAAISAC